MAKVYLIGPSIGLAKLNLQTFEAVAKKLEGMGHSVVIPHTLFHPEENEKNGLSFPEQMKRRVDALEECEVAVTLPGFSEDRCGSLEYLTAKQWKMKRVAYAFINTEL